MSLILDRCCAFYLVCTNAVLLCMASAWVGSGCVVDRVLRWMLGEDMGGGYESPRVELQRKPANGGASMTIRSVSYTHLTLPTIYSV